MSSPDEPSVHTGPRHRGSIAGLVKRYARMEERYHHDLPLGSSFQDYHIPVEDDVERDGEVGTSYGAPRARHLETVSPPRRRPSSSAPPAVPSETSPLLGENGHPKTPRDNVAANINLHGGESTDGQTLFNAIGVLIGIGLLSMPLAFSYAGWIGGVFLVIAFSAITCHTGKLLSRLLFADVALGSYTDIGMAAFGPWGGALIQCLFCTELFAFGVALIVLFGDSMNAVVPQHSAEMWMAVGFLFVLPTTFMPLRWLAVPSALSTAATALLVGIIAFDGFWKRHAPGSITDPMPTRLGPEWYRMNCVGGVGLILAGYGGHAVIPSIAKDMQNPRSMDRVFNISFTVACAIAGVSGAMGYLMMGDTVSDEISKDMVNPKYGYPKGPNVVALWLIVLVPLTKYGLTSRPLHVAFETLLGLTPSHEPEEAAMPEIEPEHNSSSFRRVSVAVSSALGRVGESDYQCVMGVGEREEPEHIEYCDHHNRQHHHHQQKQRQRRLSDQPAPHPSQASEGGKGVARALVRVAITAGCTVVAIVLPGFEKVMAFLGSFSAFLICIILPISFYLRLSSRLLPGPDGPRKTLLWWTHILVLVVSTVLMVAGTVWAFLPNTGRG